MNAKDAFKDVQKPGWDIMICLKASLSLRYYLSPIRFLFWRIEIFHHKLNEKELCCHTTRLTISRVRHRVVRP